MAVQTGGRSNDDASLSRTLREFRDDQRRDGFPDRFFAGQFDKCQSDVLALCVLPDTVDQHRRRAGGRGRGVPGGLTAATTLAQGKGIRNDDGNLKRAVYATTDDPTAIISAGNDAGFLTTGQCNNTVSGATNKVAAKVTLAAGQSKRIKFVYAWYNNVTGFEGSHNGMFYYLNAFSDAGAVADSGLAHFDQLRDNAVAR